MEKELELITEPQELMRWMSAHDILMNISIEDIGLLLNYMESHDYAIGTDHRDELVRIDLKSDELETDAYSVDDLIDQVCEWNYELILDADEKRNAPKNMIDFSNEESRYEGYKADERKLDRMFDQTKYGREVEELAVNLANEFIKNFGKNKEQAINAIAEEVKQYTTERTR